MASANDLAQFIWSVKGSVLEDVRFDTELGQKIIYLDVAPNFQKCCPHCGRACPGYDHRSSKPRKWRDVDCNGCNVYSRYNPWRVKCPEHGVVTEAVPWADIKDRFTKGFRAQMDKAMLDSTNSAVAKEFGVDWGTVERNLVRANARLNLTSTERFDGLRRIGVDETSYQKGHKYLTVVINHDTNEIIWSAEGHGFKVFSQFFEQLTPEQLKSIEYVSGDGARWIDQCVNKYVPHAHRIIDQFHIMLWISETMDKVRISEARKLRKLGFINESKAVKGSTYTLGKSYDDMTEAQKKRFSIIKSDKKLYNLYMIKEEIRNIIRDKDIDSAKNKILKVIYRLTHSEYDCVKDLGKKLKRHTDNWLNAIRFKLSNARIESDNNKIKLIIRRAYGYRNIRNLRRRICFCCASRDKIFAAV